MSTPGFDAAKPFDSVAPFDRGGPLLVDGWPLIDEAVSFQCGPNSSAPFAFWCSMIGRTQGSWTSRRGRVYELDQTQAGTATSTLRNTDGALDPGNTSSPFYPQVTPYRGYRRRAQLPATVNLLTADQATAFYSTRGAVGVGSLGPFPQWVSGVATIQASTGGNPSNYYSATSPGTFSFTGWSVAPGAAYTAQCLAFGTGSVTSQISLRFYDVTGATLSTVAGSTTGSTLAPGTRITVTATAPSNAAGAAVLVSATGSGTMYASCVQVEQGSSASAWATPGIWYDLFTGFVERWSQDWSHGGTFGTSALTCVDAFAYLSQRRLRSPGYMELLALGPNWLYPLDEGSGSTFYDLTAKSNPVVFANLLAANGGNSAAGQTLANSAASGGYLPLGVGGPVVNIVAQQIDLSARGAVGVPAGAWTRVFAFQITQSIPFNGKVFLWDTHSSDYTGELSIYLTYNGSTYGAVWLVNGGTYSGSFAFNGQPLGVGGWHIIGLAYDGAGNLTTFADDWIGTSTTAVTLPAAPYVGEWVGGPNSTTGGLQLSVVAELPFAVSGAQWKQIAESFLFGGTTSAPTSATRYADVLRWAGWRGLSAIDDLATGECRTYGASSDLQATASQPGIDGVSALQTVVDTDDGEHWVDRSGVVTFHARGWRFNRAAPVVTFGDGPGEIPYTVCSFGLDPTRLANDAAITQTSTGVATTRVDTASIGTYGDVQIQRTVNDLTRYGLVDMATYLANHYATPVQRLESLRIEPSAYTSGGVSSTAAWTALLGLELGATVQINRRPPNAPQISFTGFVEQINWSMDDMGNAACDLQVSPGVGKTFWQLDSATFSVLGSTTICGY